MDGFSISDGQYPICKKIREIKKGDLAVCRSQAVRLQLPFRNRNYGELGFMSSDISSERSVEAKVRKIVLELKKEKYQGNKIIAVVPARQ